MSDASIHLSFMENLEKAKSYDDSKLLEDIENTLSELESRARQKSQVFLDT